MAADRAFQTSDTSSCHINTGVYTIKCLVYFVLLLAFVFAVSMKRNLGKEHTRAFGAQTGTERRASEYAGVVRVVLTFHINSPKNLEVSSGVMGLSVFGSTQSMMHMLFAMLWAQKIRTATLSISPRPMASLLVWARYRAAYSLPIGEV
jgi:hypothetical protein